MISKALFTILYNGQSGYIRLASKNGESFKQAWFKFPDELDDAVEYVEKVSVDRDAYFCPHLFRTQDAHAVNAMPPIALWADLDYCRPEKLRVPPNLVQETSPNRFQALWFLKERLEPREAEAYNKRIAYAHRNDGADTSGYDLSQLLRVPMTKNFKYGEPYDIVILKSSVETRIDIEWVSEAYTDVEIVDVPLAPIPDLEGAPTASSVLNDHKVNISPLAYELFSEEPGKDWSGKLWALELSLFEAGLNEKEVYIVARDAACNKYRRDSRHNRELWKDVLRAKAHVHSRTAPTTTPPETSFSQLLTDKEFEKAANRQDFVSDYFDWAKSLSDAALQYHYAGAFFCLSATLANRIRLPTSFGEILPNMWFLILADTTLTRKTTSMGIAQSLVEEVDKDVLLATDGSTEGILSAISMRPNRCSVFLRDEVTGLVQQMSKRDYFAGMMEAFTKLYDGDTLKRVLRKEEIVIEDPVFIFYAGGIKSKMQEILTDEHVTSGFIPRFVVVTAEADVTRLKPMGPPTRQDVEKRKALLEELRAARERFSSLSKGDAGAGVTFVKRYHDMYMTDNAWARFNRLEHTMLRDAVDTDYRAILTPVFDRLAKSGLKAAMLLAASEGTTMIEEEHILRAFYFVSQWREHAMKLIESLGLTADERLIRRIYNDILAGPSVKRSTLMRKYMLTVRQADTIFMTLMQRGQITIERNTGVIRPV